MNYIGEKCAACGNVFTEDDDVVVCPDCGSPHHRDCYKSVGKCANIDFHFSGKKWERKLTKPRDIVVCSVCRFPNPKGTEKCERCGSDLTEKPQTEEEAPSETMQEPFAGLFDEDLGEARPYLGFDPDEDLGGATVKEVSDFVRTNTIYYLPIFKRMKDIGTKLSFNLTCLLFPSLYFANRKMWGWAMLAVFISVLMSIPGALIYALETEQLTDYASLLSFIEANRAIIEKLDIICSAVDFFVKLMFCLFGNSIYFKYIVRSLKRIKANGSAFMAQRLASMGGVNPANMIVITLIKAAVAIGIVMLAVYFYDLSAVLKDLDQSAVIMNMLK